MNREKIRARRAGREKIANFSVELARVTTHELQIALALDPPVGVEFSLRRELRRREIVRGGPR